ncbi:lipoyl(octanoyl) transferase LipB [Paenibacillus sp. S150]|uniref:lipoyl(octanoyl) transferase LipB n=1 Tax=Paenibacillus sp. S150 TaxID=2749826 RepID=UPI001C5819EB|nr:lipoyl(octanoyl) transferase LipB [Paenibacillus sp. S150]MBW4081775.1 lipoyl(octanoyl) transferase LipB [Paenibacillus sp. S150]
MSSKDLSLLEVSYLPLMEYGAAWKLQREAVAAIDAGTGNEQLILLQHPPTYTIGSQHHPEHLLLSAEQLKEQGIALFEIDRGGDITYHGPGQLVGYPLLKLGEDGRVDLHGYLRRLESVIIDFLAAYGIEGGRKPEYTGVWVGDEKICAIGVKFNKSKFRRGFITSHGFAFNITAGIGQQGFQGIIPCGIAEYGVTSLEECAGRPFEPGTVARELVPYFLKHFPYEVPAAE